LVSSYYSEAKKKEDRDVKKQQAVLGKNNGTVASAVSGRGKKKACSYMFL
jgi:hypothetical protein